MVEIEVGVTIDDVYLDVHGYYIRCGGDMW
jgi:hypothetical protein